MFRRYKLKNFDFLLVLLVIALNVIGILAIGSAKVYRANRFSAWQSV